MYNRRQQEGTENKQEKISKMAITTYISITTLNVNGLNTPIKRHKVAG